MLEIRFCLMGHGRPQYRSPARRLLEVGKASLTKKVKDKHLFIKGSTFGVIEYASGYGNVHLVEKDLQSLEHMNRRKGIR